MKKFLLLCFVISFSFGLHAQLIKAPATLRNHAVKTPARVAKDKVSANTNVLTLPHSKAFAEDELGSTYYDLMTNRSCYNRLYLYPDGTIGAAWTMALLTNFGDRGTGYNYFDGTAWGPAPTARIESVRTGFASYSPFGAGELVVAHSADQLVLSKRDAKGTGAWTEILIPYGTTEPTWPRVCVVGNTIHVICVDFTSAKLLYFRSTDGGATWDKQGDEIPEVSTTFYPNGFDADAYDWAPPVGNTIAFLVGDKATDVVLMKSTDGGDTWTKTIVFQHPYPLFLETTTLTPDTPYVCDAAHAITLDASGNAYVAFGLSRFLNDDLTDGTYSWFPGVDGIAFWKEGQPAITNADPDNVYLNCKLVGYLQDIDSSGIVLDNYTTDAIADYQVSTTSMPQITIGSDGNLYLIFRSLVETMMSGTGQFYSHIWGRKSTDGGDTWSEFVDLTGDADHEQVECVYPSMSPTTNGKILYTYMSDYEPGTNLGGDVDPIVTNYIYCASNDFADFSSTVVPCTVNKNEINLNGNVNIYPNPVLDNMNVTFSINKSASVNMTIFNALGSVVKNSSFIANGRGENNQISIKELPTGMYLVKFETASGTYTQKIVKK